MIPTEPITVSNGLVMVPGSIGRVADSVVVVKANEPVTANLDQPKPALTLVFGPSDG